MTSSLVGSEMCIRDSLFRGPAGCARAPRWCRSVVGDVLCGFLVDGGFFACLLYTSDAADDM
eukprot:11547809-Prorocentrum_lima.AAC.1